LDLSFIFCAPKIPVFAGYFTKIAVFIETPDKYTCNIIFERERERESERESDIYLTLHFPGLSYVPHANKYGRGKSALWAQTSSLIIMMTKCNLFLDFINTSF
jgi:hypothetical protein